MIYVAFLRSINVGGRHPVEMAKLRQTFEALDFTKVKTFIASGNVIFCSEDTDYVALASRIETAIARDFGFPVPVLVRSMRAMAELAKAIPAAWVNNAVMKCDVMLLWPEIDNPGILTRIPHNPRIEDILYAPGAVIWRVDRDRIRQGAVLQIADSTLHKQLTVRNANTIRKLYDLMLAAEKS